MRNRYLRTSGIILMILLAILLGTACGAQGNDEVADQSLVLTGIGETEIEIPYNDILSMTPEKKTVISIPSGEAPEEVEIVGVHLDDVLAPYGVSLKDFTLIRGLAGDNYQIDIPQDVFLNGGLYLIWEQNGQPLDEHQKPIRIAVDGHRSMFWVSNLIRMEFETDSIPGQEAESTIDVQKIVFLDAAASMLDTYEITYYDSVDSSIKVSDLFAEYDVEGGGRAVVEASDGFEKTEEIDVLATGYFKMTGKDAPLFISADLPKGLHIKSIMYLTCGETAFVAEQSLAEMNQPVKLSDVMNRLGLDSDKYVITGADGNRTEIEKDIFMTGELTRLDSDNTRVEFNAQYQIDAVENILLIQPLNE